MTEISDVRGRQRRALRGALVANASFLVVEVIAGLAANSLALLADAAHMLSDVAALGIALAAQRLIDRPATRVHSFGLQRAEVLAAQANGVVLLVAAVAVVVAAVRRLGSPVEVEGGILLVAAVAGLAVNVGSAVWLARVRGTSLNVTGALMHLSLDAVGSIAAIVAGVAVVTAGAVWVDPVASMFVAALVVWSAWHLLRETAHVLLEGTPRGVDVAAVERAVVDHPQIDAVHHVHVWSLASDTTALSAHVVIGEQVTLHEAQVIGEDLKAMLADRFGVAHATLELECHVCEPADPSH